MLYSTLALLEIMRNKKIKKRRAVWIKDWLKQREEKITYNNVISVCHCFH